MAESIQERITRLKAEYPGAPVVTYVNSSAGVKAESDICCTAANAQKIVQSVEAERIIFKRESPDKEFVPARADAVCVDMKKITLEKIRPEVKVEEPVRSKANEAIVKMLSVS